MASACQEISFHIVGDSEVSYHVHRGQLMSFHDYTIQNLVSGNISQGIEKFCFSPGGMEVVM